MAPKNTSALLMKLRTLMKNTAHVPQPLHAYIVPSGDAHQVREISILSFMPVVQSSLQAHYVSC